jgi:hypothetical protein
MLPAMIGEESNQWRLPLVECECDACHRALPTRLWRPALLLFYLIDFS